MQSNGIKFMGLIMIGLVLCMMSMSVTGTSPPYFPPKSPYQIRPARPPPPVQRSRGLTCDCGREPDVTQMCCAGQLKAEFNGLSRCQGISNKQSFIGCCGRPSKARCN
ncbi:unnamed protein product [Adineta steineri]|uniref:Uncharacterized protein n=1 Tax=Adineta steineri TaxID=433720 RepID=A0A819J3L7_9BILA|nr:unnamed protein product [Adineta steineri]CAF3922717.1 unnamed protein product [Adineta steineri]CAF3922739.1 unnamed protein product [Adineta steineri]